MTSLSICGFGFAKGDVSSNEIKAACLQIEEKHFTEDKAAALLLYA